MVRFTCPACGKVHAVPKFRVPEGGIRGACSACNATLFVNPDGRVDVEGAPSLSLPERPSGPDPDAEVPQPTPLIETDPSVPWEIQMDGQVLGPFTLGDMKQLILGDRLPADRLIRPREGDWAPAASFALISAFYAPRERGEKGSGDSFGSEDRCFQHPGHESSHMCSQCQRHMCPSCVKGMQTHGGMKTIPICPVCGGPCIVLKKRTRWAPFYRDVRKALLAPFEKGHPIFYFGILVFLQELKIPCAIAPLVGLMAIFILTVFQTTFYIHLIREVGNGSYDYPEWPETSNYGEMVFGLLKVVFVTLVALLPAILVGCFGGAALGGVAGLAGSKLGDGALAALLGPWIILVFAMVVFYLMYLPICIAIVAIFNTVLPALNPFVIFKIIARIGPTYFLAVALWVALFAINLLLKMILGRFGFVGGLLHAPVEVYTSLVMAYTLGRVAYENEERIGWE